LLASAGKTSGNFGAAGAADNASLNVQQQTLVTMSASALCKKGDTGTEVLAYNKRSTIAVISRRQPTDISATPRALQSLVSKSKRHRATRIVGPKTRRYSFFLRAQLQ